MTTPRRKTTKTTSTAKLGRRHKYGAKRTTAADGKSFASRAEARRYAELRLLERAGRIANLRLQVRFRLVDVCVYVADFVYNENGAQVVEDVKGFRTAEYKRKRRLMADQHGIAIKETK
jgi:hypothetical protein